MVPDYYQILSVDPSADAETIKTAFRRKVLECHPDRGGSHEKMILVNEAWEVLSNSEVRARYNEARSNVGNSHAQQAAAKDTERARQRADQYPRKWADVENWLNGIADDFKKAEYGSIPLHQDIHWPTAGDSVSGCFFIVLGAGLGGIILSTIIYGLFEKYNIPVFGKNQGYWTVIKLMIIASPILGGAWLGKYLHECISTGLKLSSPSNSPHTNGSTSSNTGKPPESSDQHRILSCEKCGQKLRIPSIKSEVLVTCRSCGHKFTCRSVE